MARPNRKTSASSGSGSSGRASRATLRKRGMQVYVWNRTPRPEQNFVGSPVEVAELCDVVQIFVSDDEALLEIVRATQPRPDAQHIVTAHSTVSPESMRAAAEIVQRRGARFLDAPFHREQSGGGKRTARLLHRRRRSGVETGPADPRSEQQGNRFHRAEIGDATVMKVATNMITAATAQVAAEALALVRKAGIRAGNFQRRR